MVGYSEKGWFKWKMRRGKWPDLGLNPFPFHFSFINNPQTTQSTPNHILSTPPPPLLLPQPSLSPSHFPLRPKYSSRNLLEREKQKHLCAVVLFGCGKKRVRRVEKEMGGIVKVAIRMPLSVACGGISESLFPSLSPSKVCVDTRAVP